jgi:hypothetical protein
MLDIVTNVDEVEFTPTPVTSVGAGEALVAGERTVKSLLSSDPAMLSITSDSNTVTLNPVPITSAGLGQTLVAGDREVKSLESNTILIDSTDPDVVTLELVASSAGTGTSLISAQTAGSLVLKSISPGSNVTFTPNDANGFTINALSGGSVTSTAGTGETMVEAGLVKTIDSSTILVDSSLDNLTTTLEYSLNQLAATAPGATSLIQNLTTAGTQSILALAPAVGADLSFATPAASNSLVISTVPVTSVGAGSTLVAGSRTVKSLTSGTIDIDSTDPDEVNLELAINSVGAGTSLIESSAVGLVELKSLLAGSNITFDESTSGQFTINALSGGAVTSTGGPGATLVTAGQVRTLNSTTIAINGGLASSLFTTLNFNLVQAAATGASLIQPIATAGQQSIRALLPNSATGQGDISFANPAGNNMIVSTVPITSVGTGSSQVAGSRTIKSLATSGVLGIGTTTTTTTVSLAVTSSGGGTSIISSNTAGSGILALRNLIGGTNVSLSNTAAGITINSTGGSGSAQNNGTGADVYVDSTSNPFQFRSLISNNPRLAVAAPNTTNVTFNYTDTVVANPLAFTNPLAGGSRYFPVINPGAATTYNLFGIMTDGSLTSTPPVSPIVPTAQFNYMAVNPAISNPQRLYSSKPVNTVAIANGLQNNIVMVTPDARVTLATFSNVPPTGRFYESAAAISTGFVNNNGLITPPRTSLYQIMFKIGIVANFPPNQGATSQPFGEFDIQFLPNSVTPIPFGNIGLCSYINPLLANDDSTHQINFTARLVGGVNYRIDLSIRPRRSGGINLNTFEVIDGNFSIMEIM